MIASVVAVVAVVAIVAIVVRFNARKNVSERMADIYALREREACERDL